MELNPISDHLASLPKVLYKYRTFDPGGFGIALAAYGEAYFADARTFNDPFECWFIPRSKVIELEGAALEAFVREAARRGEPGAREERIEELVAIGVKQAERLKRGDPSALDGLMSTQYNAIGVLSLVENPRSLPMWSYYADSHRGFCVGLRTEVLGEHQAAAAARDDIMVLHKVEYDQRMPEVSVGGSFTISSEGDMRQIEKPFYTKSRDWRHEAELRLTYWHHPNHAYRFGQNAVEEIILGCCASEADSKLLLDSLQKAGSKAPVVKASTSKKSYELIFERTK